MQHSIVASKSQSNPSKFEHKFISVFDIKILSYSKLCSNGNWNSPVETVDRFQVGTFNDMQSSTAEIAFNFNLKRANNSLTAVNQTIEPIRFTNKMSNWKQRLWYRFHLVYLFVVVFSFFSLRFACKQAKCNALLPTSKWTKCNACTVRSLQKIVFISLQTFVLFTSTAAVENAGVVRSQAQMG